MPFIPGSAVKGICRAQALDEAPEPFDDVRLTPASTSPTNRVSGRQPGTRGQSLVLPPFTEK
jgi:hypothetical protein